MKRIIKRDEKGLYVSAEGSKCRPMSSRITTYREEGASVEVTLSGIGRGGFFVEMPNGETWPAEMPEYVVNPKKKARSPRKMQVRDLDEKKMYHLLKGIVSDVNAAVREGSSGDAGDMVIERLRKAGFEFPHYPARPGDRGRNGN